MIKGIALRNNKINIKIYWQLSLKTIKIFGKLPIKFIAFIPKSFENCVEFVTIWWAQWIQEICQGIAKKIFLWITKFLIFIV